MTPLPFFSIVVPTCNRPARLEACVRAVAALDYPRGRFELIVVNDGGADDIEARLRSFDAAIEIKVIQQPNSGPAAARNRGAAAAAGEWLAFTDDDCEPARDWLTQLAAQVRHSPGCAIGGVTLNGLTGNVYSTVSTALVAYVIEYYDADPGRVKFFPTSNLACPADRFRRVGGFNPGYRRAGGEDRELCDRWQQHGYAMVQARSAIVRHSHHLTAGSFVRQHLSYGRGACLYRRHRALARRGPVRFESLSFYVRMATCLFGTHSVWTAVRSVPLLALAQAANAAGFFWQYWNGVPADDVVPRKEAAHFLE